jgi:hypothetical protein
MQFRSGRSRAVSALSGILAERLLAFVPHLDKVFFSNSGRPNRALASSALSADCIASALGAPSVSS